MPHHVFLCHNHRDKPAVNEIAHRLREKGISPWLDEWELRPGQPWQAALEEQIREIPAAAVFVGKDGLGPWQNQELAAFLRQFVKRSCPVIPVILPACKKPPELPVFLENMTWVDFRKKDPDPVAHLIWGVTGKRPDATTPDPSPPPPRAARPSWRVWIAAALTAAAAYAIYLRAFPSSVARAGGQVTLWRHADGEAREVRAENAFHSGDGLHFAVTPRNDGWLFVLHRSAGGELQAVWPRPGHDNAVSVDSTVIVPSSPGFFRLDEEESEELFYVAIAVKPNAEKRIRELIGERRLDRERDGLAIAFTTDERDPEIAVTEIRVRHSAPPGS